MPCLFWASNNDITPTNQQPEKSSYNNPISSSDGMSSLNTLDLSNPFNIVATVSPLSSVWSLNSLHQIDEQQERSSNYFEPLPFSDTQQQVHHPQLSQKHTIIKQMIARQAAQRRQQQQRHHKPCSSMHSHYSSCDNLFSQSSSFSFHQMTKTLPIIVSPSNRHRKRYLCSFCKSNGESVSVYTSHNLRNANNDIECPVLMAYVCPKCGATGKSAHTIKYCTALSECERVSLPTVKLFKEGRCAAGNKNLFKK